MRRLLVLGGGTAGTIIANKLQRRLDDDEWDITVVDQDDSTTTSPGYLFVPFGTYTRDDVVRGAAHFLAMASNLVLGEIDRVDADANQVSSRAGASWRTTTW